MSQGPSHQPVAPSSPRRAFSSSQARNIAGGEEIELPSYNSSQHSLPLPPPSYETPGYLFPNVRPDKQGPNDVFDSHAAVEGENAAATAAPAIPPAVMSAARAPLAVRFPRPAPPLIAQARNRGAAATAAAAPAAAPARPAPLPSRCERNRRIGFSFLRLIACFLVLLCLICGIRLARRNHEIEENREVVATDNVTATSPNFVVGGEGGDEVETNGDIAEEILSGAILRG